ncbi:hypothetical protein [Butyrivibrio sp. VCB2006]|uniref:hypothetical protein n=1 Tax=Butyrivibrio sp. VCB2006 TaxID=1280679 RepID=UPI0003F9FD0D|nr:hypothetical protein [Butyrivibrio sp. VCB2006]
MKKKVLASAAAAVVIMANALFTVEAFAQSVTTTIEIAGVGRSAEEAETAGAQVLGATRNAVSGEGITTSKIKDKAIVNTLSKTETVVQIINNVLASATNNETSSKVSSGNTTKTATALKAEEVSVIQSMDLNVATGTDVSEEKPLYVAFSFAGLNSKSEVYVLHFHNGLWEVVESTVTDGKIVAKFTSFSPVAIVAKTNTLNGAVLGTERKTSPRTGDSIWLLVIAGAALVAIAAAALQKKFFHD